MHKARLRGAVIVLLLLVFVAACTPAQVTSFLQMMGGGSAAGPMGGELAALPTAATTETPEPSSFSAPTEAPNAVGPLATMTALAGMVATPDLAATPYAIAINGRPHFVEFQARW